MSIVNINVKNVFVHYRQTIKNKTYTADDSNGHSAYYGGKFRNKAEHGRIYGGRKRIERLPPLS